MRAVLLALCLLAAPASAGLLGGCNCLFQLQVSELRASDDAVSSGTLVTISWDPDFVATEHDTDVHCFIVLETLDGERTEIFDGDVGDGTTSVTFTATESAWVFVTCSEFCGGDTDEILIVVD